MESPHIGSQGEEEGRYTYADAGAIAPPSAPSSLGQLRNQHVVIQRQSPVDLALPLCGFSVWFFAQTTSVYWLREWNPKGIAVLSSKEESFKPWHPRKPSGLFCTLLIDVAFTTAVGGVSISRA